MIRITDNPIIVIGAGVSGLLSALMLSKEGNNVIVLESQDDIGGMCKSYAVGQYHVDTGPHIITRLDGGPLKTLIDDYFSTMPVFVPHGEYYVCASDKIRPFPWTLRAFAQFDIIPKTDRVELMQLVAYLYSQRTLGMLKGDTSVESVVRNRFFSDQTLRFIDVMCRFMTGNGMDKTPLARFFDSQDYKNKKQVQDPLDYLNTIKNLVTKKGAQDQTYPKGGIQSIIDAICASFSTGKVEIRTGCTVTGIDVHDGAVTGVSTDKGPLSASCVIYSSYASLLPTLTDSLDKSYAQSLLKLEKVLSLTLWLGLDKQFFPLRGSEIWVETDPPCWVVPTSNYDETLAPEGHQLVGFTTNIAPDADLESEKDRMYKAVIAHVEGIDKHIDMVHWQTLVPEKAAWVINQEMPEAKTPITGLYLVGTDTTNKSMGVTRASYSVLALRDALREDGII